MNKGVSLGGCGGVYPVHDFRHQCHGLIHAGGSRLLAGPPADETIWVLIDGAVMPTVGAIAALPEPK